jgi:hypothetical protein
MDTLRNYEQEESEYYGGFDVFARCQKELKCAQNLKNNNHQHSAAGGQLHAAVFFSAFSNRCRVGVSQPEFKASEGNNITFGNDGRFGYILAVYLNAAFGIKVGYHPMAFGKGNNCMASRNKREVQNNIAQPASSD